MRHVAAQFFALFSLLAPAAAWQQDSPPDLQLLLSIKRRMAGNLALMPNYTCLETVSRATRDSASSVVNRYGRSNRFRRTDLFRLEVAEIRGDELFARPGDHDFRKRSLRDLVPNGLMGNGVFSILAHSVFQTNDAVIHSAGEENIAGLSLYRFDFEVPELASNYSIRTSGGEATVGYRGSFWADKQTLNPVRVDYAALAIPAKLGISASETRIDYALTRIGDAEVLLPQSAEMTMSQSSGWADRNRIGFTHCKEYGVKSAISFEDAKEAQPGGGFQDIVLPPALRIVMRLESAIDPRKAQVGDPITARVEVDVKRKGQVVVPRGAVAHGRVRALQREGKLVITLEFSQLEFNRKRARFLAELEKVIAPPGSRGVRRVPSADLTSGDLTSADLPGVGALSAAGPFSQVTPDIRMFWRTTQEKVPHPSK